MRKLSKIIDRNLLHEYIQQIYSFCLLFMQSYGKQLHIIFVEQFSTTLINVKHIFSQIVYEFEVVIIKR